MVGAHISDESIRGAAARIVAAMSVEEKIATVSGKDWCVARSIQPPLGCPFTT